MGIIIYLSTYLQPKEKERKREKGNESVSHLINSPQRERYKSVEREKGRERVKTEGKRVR